MLFVANPDPIYLTDIFKKAWIFSTSKFQDAKHDPDYTIDEVKIIRISKHRIKHNSEKERINYKYIYIYIIIHNFK